MGPVIQFVMALAVAATTLAGGSIAWPKLTSQPRPQLLQQVHDFVIRTPAGQRTADVLGVSDESRVEPINIGVIAGNGVTAIKQSVQNRIQTIVVGNAVNELTRQFDRLSEDQKQTIQEALCKPIKE